MILTQEIRNLVTEWDLRDSVIEKDYVIGWLLWGIATEPVLNDSWAFKGGTALKKCYIETWRFSEDLDFTVLPKGPYKPEVIKPLIEKILERVHDESGIDFSINPPSFKHSEKYCYTSASIYYRGPLNARKPARIKLDISGSEKTACQTVLRTISHPYSDALPLSAQIRCYAFEEVFAEKIRAMGERGRPRDLYDIVLLFRYKDIQSNPQLIKNILVQKCKTKGVPIPTLRSIQNAATKSELISEWPNMLGHQLQVLPSFEQYWEKLPNIFNWLAGNIQTMTLPLIDAPENDDLKWKLPPMIRQWGLAVPLESIRFAAVNQLCVELGYNGGIRLIEPYALHCTKEKIFILCAARVDNGQPRNYRIDRIESLKVTTKTFRPRYEIEFLSSEI